MTKKKTKPALKIADLPLRTLDVTSLTAVAGGEPPHDCGTGSGAGCALDDCGPWSGGQSNCG